MKKIKVLKRNAYQDLEIWNNNKLKKPLIIRGIRQIGKTFIVKEFAKNNYKKVIYLNLKTSDLDTEYSFLVKTLKTLPSFEIWVKKIITIFGAINKDTILIIDEVQEDIRIYEWLRTWYESENLPNNFIILGSWLDMYLWAKKGKLFIPMGSYESLNVAPLSFEEYLQNVTKNNIYLDGIKDILANNQDARSIHKYLAYYYEQYELYGGFPNIVIMHLNNEPNQKLAKYYEDYLKDFIFDMNKYQYLAKELKHMKHFWDLIKSIFANLDQNTPAYKFSILNKNAKPKDYKKKIELLKSSKLIAKLDRYTTLNNILKKDNKFKLYPSDAGLSLSYLKNYNDVNTFDDSYLGTINENTIFNTLKQNCKIKNLGYWYYLDYNKKKPREIDFIFSYQNKLVMVDAKRKNTKRTSSFKRFVVLHNPDIKIKISHKALAFHEDYINIPVYLTYWITDILDLWLDKTKRLKFIELNS